MLELAPATHCRLSGESLSDAAVLFEVPSCPIAGLYPESVEESKPMRSPLRVIQARRSRLVQLGHVFDPVGYGRYAFAGAGSASYRRHLAIVAAELESQLPRSDARILEIGCGDGALLRELRTRGFHHALGIDPSRAAVAQGEVWIASGFFPKDLPPNWTAEGFDLIVTRHVLEHVETPVDFVQALAAMLRPGGLVCIEVPDLDSTVQRGLWSNFYQLHCNYFNASTLDRLLGMVGLRPVSGHTVEVFGGSLLRYYRHGPGADNAAGMIDQIAPRVRHLVQELDELALQLPASTVGYGAAERTASTLGLCPALEQRLVRLHDGNRLLHGRFLAGTRLQIGSPAELYACPPAAVVLFAVSNAAEILGEFRRHLPPSVAIAIAGRGCQVRPLGEIAP